MPHPPLTLAIEASNPGSPEAGRGTPAADASASVALGHVHPDGRVDTLGHEPLRTESRKDDDLLPAIARLCERAGVTPKQIGRVAVSTGPGGFTGLRVAVAAAKAICEATGAAATSVPTARALVRRLDALAGAHCAVALAWKRDDAWLHTFARTEHGWRDAAPPRLAPLHELAAGDVSILIADAALEHMLRERGVLPGSVRVVAPRFDAIAVLEASADEPDVDPLALEPIYPREPEAVTKWRALHGPKHHA
jgi:tRNA threonylcarbamoyladenosine biosynthesis protein TsaB